MGGRKKGWMGEAGGQDVDCECQARQRGVEGDERGEGMVKKVKKERKKKRVYLEGRRRDTLPHVQCSIIPREREGKDGTGHRDTGLCQNTQSR